MAEGGFDDFEMRDRNWEEERREEEYDETNFDQGEDDYWEKEELMTKKGIKIPDVKRDAKSMRLSMTRGNEKVFEEIFDFPLRKKYGEFSKQLLSEIRFEKLKTRVAIFFKDKRIAKYQNNRLEYLKINRPMLNEFKMVLEQARKEFSNSLESTFYDRLEGFRGDLPPVVEDEFREEVLSRSLEKLDENVDKSKQKMRNIEEDNRMIPPPNELRELNGILNPKGQNAEEKINFLEIQAKYWKRREGQVTQPEMKQWYREAEKITKNQAEKIRLESDMRPQEEETQEILQQEMENTDLSRYERFKKWSKKNMFGLASTAISIAGFVATIITLARSGLCKTAEAIGDLAKSIGQFGKEFGSVFIFGAGVEAAGFLLEKLLAWGKEGLEHLSNNLWIVGVAGGVYFLVKKYIYIYINK